MVFLVFCFLVFVSGALLIACLFGSFRIFRSCSG